MDYSAFYGLPAEASGRFNFGVLVDPLLAGTGNHRLLVEAFLEYATHVDQMTDLFVMGTPVPGLGIDMSCLQHPGVRTWIVPRRGMALQLGLEGGVTSLVFHPQVGAVLLPSPIPAINVVAD